ncbi:hypothetical protein GCM10010468_52890 [Actinocorallia longicatena]|uniref:Polyhydroxybutyrate depolymerase n=1 Tax=Actinocorallia longicatena TaxID=111803 RepID=A0ABP6QIK3_9ACTN
MLSAAALCAVMPSGARAAAPPADHVVLAVEGGPAYRLDADVTGGGIAVTDTVGDYAVNRIRGTATLPGGAALTVGISRGPLGLGGSLSFEDRGADVRITAVVAGGVTARGDGTVAWRGTALVRSGGGTALRNVALTVEDRRPDPGDHAIRITHAGQARNAILRLPDDYDGTPRPVLFHFPGLVETPWMAELFGRMADYAQKHGFIMITPEHHGIAWQEVGSQHDVPPDPDVDDPGFVDRLQDILVSRFNADPRRLYASGMSNGGYFTSKMACENGRFAAFAPVAGQLDDPATCRPGRHIPIILIHGDADPVVDYAEAPVSAAFWARNNSCAPTTTDTTLPDLDPADGTTVVRSAYDGCPSDGPVTLLRIRGGGHNWPGGIPFLGPLLGGTTHDIDANAAIWTFVSTHRLP